MCQRIQDGGRRCPKHQHVSKAIFGAITSTTLLNRVQVENLFLGLRREGQNTPLPVNPNVIQETFANIVSSYNLTHEEQVRTQNQYQKSVTYNEHTQIDGATYYALQTITTRANQQDAALKHFFNDVIERTGLTQEQINKKYTQAMAEATGTPPEYTRTNREKTAAANLPHNKATVVALQKLEQLQTTQKRRIHHTKIKNSQIASYGYDEGRLEVKMRGEEDTILAYNHVPPLLYKNMVESSRPAQIFLNIIRTNEGYQYKNKEEAERDRYLYRCAGCGQFSSLKGHTCPNKVPNSLTPQLDAHPITPTNNTNALTPSPTFLGEEFPTPESLTTFVLNSTALGEDNDPNNILGLTSEQRQKLASKLAQELINTTESTVTEQMTANIASDTDEADSKLLEKAYPLPRNTIISRVVNSFGFEEDRGHVLTPEMLQEGTSDTIHRGKENVLPDFLTEVGITQQQMDTLIQENPGKNWIFLPRKNNNGRWSYTPTPVDTEKFRVDYYYLGGRDNSTLDALSKYVISPKIETVLGHNKARDSFSDTQQQIENLIDEGKAVKITHISARKSSSIYSDITTSIGSKAGIVRAIYNHPDKLLALPVHIKMSPYAPAANGGLLLKHASYLGPDYRQKVEVSGNVLVRMLPDGRLENFSTPSSLKCECNTYRTKYYCSHTYFATKRMNALIQENLPSNLIHPNAPTRTSQDTLTKPDEFLRRPEVQVVNEINSDGTQTDNQIYRFSANIKDAFNEDNLVINTKTYTSIRSSLFTVPEAHHDLNNINFDLHSEQFSTTDNLTLLRNMILVGGFAHKIILPKNITGLDSLLQQANVEIPIGITSLESQYRWYNNEKYKTLGTVTLKKMSENDTEYQTDSTNLKCNCEEYKANNYHCIHTRMIAENVHQIFHLNNPTFRNNFQAYPNQENNPPRIDRPQTDSIQNFSRVLASYDNEDEILEEDGVRISETAATYFRQRLQEASERIQAREQRQAQREAERLQAQKEREKILQERNLPTTKASETYRTNMLQRWENIDPGYTNNPQKFYEDYAATLKRKRNNETIIPFITQNVTDGICAEGEGTRSFGIEIEFDFPKEMKNKEKKKNLKKIGKALQEAKLTTRQDQQQYHAAARNGWADWSFERDATVAGEIVSPLMKDTPEHWEQLRKVCEIVKNNGGIASKRTGSHVHISTSSYETSIAKHAELLRQAEEHQEVLFRIASNPQRNSHRGTSWCAPNVRDTLDKNIPFNTETDLNNHSNNFFGNYSSHSRAMNFQGTAQEEYKKSHVEFRMWDGTLDPAIIQQQVAVSAAMTDVAEKTVIQKGKSERAKKKDFTKLGKMRKKEINVLGGEPRKTHTQETLSQVSEPATHFLDKFFRKQEDRERVASLLAITKWVKTYNEYDEDDLFF